MNKEQPITKYLSPIGDKVLCKQIEGAEDGLQSDKIVIPEMAKQVSRIYEVLRLGTEREDNKPWPVKVGERILIAQYCGVDVGKNLKIILTSDIQGVYRDE